VKYDLGEAGLEGSALECLLRTMLLERSESMRIPTWLLVFLLGAGIILVVVLMINVVIY
jgi:hypothetical protein